LSYAINLDGYRRAARLDNGRGILEAVAELLPLELAGICVAITFGMDHKTIA
jgi:hypothetical protein